jgi:uncharacterized membrane protein (UPF0182 family)
MKRGVIVLKKKIGLVTVIFSVLLIIIFLDRIVDFCINVQWFMEVGYLQIYFTKITATLKLMVPIFIIFYVCIWLYYKSIRKSILKLNKVIEVNAKKRKTERIISTAINASISFILSYSFAANYWYRILQFTNSTNFNVKDPVFYHDISFYIFRLPLLQSLYNMAMGLLVVLILTTFVIYFLMNVKDRIYSMDIRNAFSNMKVIQSGLTAFAGKQLAVASALILLLLSAGYLIKAYYLLYNPGGVVYGAGYTDVNVTLLFYRIIAAVSLIAAIVVFISILTSKVKPIIISVAAIAVLMVLGGVSSTLVQTLIVKSNQISFEEDYIKNNIDYTRKAFSIDDITEQQYRVNDILTKEDINNNRETIDNIKVNSFKPALDFYNQTQVLRYYYGFNDIDIDRYKINGKYSQVFIAPREINSDSIEPNTWQSKHLVYTHGYGVVMSKVNSVTPEGQPNFVIKDIPPENNTDIELKNTRIYFGEKTNYYAVVNTDINEFDYPKGGDNQVNKYDGKNGIGMSLFNRLLFAINERDANFLLSRDINSSSKILLNRNIIDRVKKIAPFLVYDQDPYIVISEGKLFWIIDGYTISDRYPYAQPYNGINYIRNSVKVVVDAFDGTTNFYIADKMDPIINSYSKIFKGLFKDLDTLSADIKSHFRYPEDMYKIQCNVLGKYHMTDPKVFFTGEDLWEIATNEKKTDGDKTLNEASYVVMKLPDEKSEEMVLLEYFNMREKENMTAMLGARMDKDNYGKLVLYKFPSNQTVYGPLLFKKKINQDTNISKELSLWQGKGSTVDYGDTMIVPIDNSLLYIEPMYLIAEGKNSIPEMKRVIVSYGEKIVLAENIDKALELLFNYSDGKQQQTPSSGNANGSNEIKQIKDLYDKAVEAQKNGDWAKYGEYLTQLGELLNKIAK